MKRLPLFKLVLLSLVGAMAIHFTLLACNTISGSPDSRVDAAPTTACSAWQVTYYFSKVQLSTSQEGLGTPVNVPAGWEPMGILPYAEGLVTTVRKCVN